MLTSLHFDTLMIKPHSENLNKKQLLQALQTEGSKALEQLYVAYREDFLAFARRYETEEADILDVYQDAIIALFENVNSGKISSLKSTVKTYLFSIGKFKLIDRLKAKGKMLPTEEVDQWNDQIDNSFEEQEELTQRQLELKEAINELGEQCKELLTLFYYRQYSIEAIRLTMDYKNDNTVKANKSRCMKSLREIILERGIK